MTGDGSIRDDVQSSEHDCILTPTTVPSVPTSPDDLVSVEETLDIL